MARQGEHGISWLLGYEGRHGETWNPLRGCSKVSAGCSGCYAERTAARFIQPGQPYHGLADLRGRWTGRVWAADDLEGVLGDPLRWDKPRAVFPNSMSDLFHESLEDGQIDRVLAVIAATPHHVYFSLTKRAERMLTYLLDPGTRRRVERGVRWLDAAVPGNARRRGDRPFVWPLPNLFLGVSAENQEAWDERVYLLANCPAAVRWVSVEPMLGAIRTGLGDRLPVDIAGLDPAARSLRWRDVIHWIVVGGESGKNARPMLPEWPRAIRDECIAADVAFHFKQWGEWGDWFHDHVGRVAIIQRDGKPILWRVGKRAAGRELDGKVWDEYPRVNAA